MLERLFEKGFDEAVEASAAPRPIESLKDLLSTSVAFDLETSSQPDKRYAQKLVTLDQAAA